MHDRFLALFRTPSRIVSVLSVPSLLYELIDRRSCTEEIAHNQISFAPTQDFWY
jgi:hypothetical protein